MASELTTKLPEVDSEIKAEPISGMVDIGKRIDVNRPINETQKNGVDIGKRISEQRFDDKPSYNESDDEKDTEAKTDLSKKLKDYVDDLKQKAKFPEAINDDCIDQERLEVQSPDKVKELREEFDDIKSELRNEWEKLNGQEWPRYTEQEIQELGITDRKAGDRYDAHHIQPLQLGGKNEASNITPLRVTEHRDIHSSGGSCKALVDSLVGGAA